MNEKKGSDTCCAMQIYKPNILIVERWHHLEPHVSIPNIEVLNTSMIPNDSSIQKTLVGWPLDYKYKSTINVSDSFTIHAM